MKDLFKRLFWKFIGFVEIILVLFYIVYEELVYTTIAKPIIEWYKKLKLLAKFQAFLLKAPPIVSLLAFLSTFVVAEILGLLTVPVFLMGPPIAFIGVFIYGLKIPVGAFAFWIFKENKERLTKYKIIKIGYDWTMRFVNWIDSSEVYKRVKERAKKYKEMLKKMKGEKSTIFKKIIVGTKAKYVWLKSKLKRKGEMK